MGGAHFGARSFGFPLFYGKTGTLRDQNDNKYQCCDAHDTGELLLSINLKNAVYGTG